MASSVRKAGLLSRFRGFLGGDGTDALRAERSPLIAEPDAAFPDRAPPGFDIAATPTWFWAQSRPIRGCVVIAPPGAPTPGLVWAGKTDLLDRIGSGGSGLFLVDWPRIAAEGGEWAALWSTTDMRLNRLVMDAFSLAAGRGWAIRVVGPVDRAEAPFFQTVEAVAEIVTREGAEALLSRVAP